MKKLGFGLVRLPQTNSEDWETGGRGISNVTSYGAKNEKGWKAVCRK